MTPQEALQVLMDIAIDVTAWDGDRFKAVDEAYEVLKPLASELVTLRKEKPEEPLPRHKPLITAEMLVDTEEEKLQQRIAELEAARDEDDKLFTEQKNRIRELMQQLADVQAKLQAAELQITDYENNFSAAHNQLAAERKRAEEAEAKVTALQTLLTDTINEGYARHAEGCSGGIPRDYPSKGVYYPCKCGFRDWQAQVEKALKGESDADRNS